MGEAKEITSIRNGEKGRVTISMSKTTVPLPETGDMRAATSLQGAVSLQSESLRTRKALRSCLVTECLKIYLL